MASAVVGAVVGTFKVGDGTVVGPPRFVPDKPKLTLNGKRFTVFAATSIVQVSPGKARMKLSVPTFYTLDLIVSSTIVIAHSPDLSLNGGDPYRIVTPGRQITGKPRMTLKAKSYRLNKSDSPQLGKAKLILKAGALGKVGKAGLVPVIPLEKPLNPAAIDDWLLIPTVLPEEEILLVPTVEEFV